MEKRRRREFFESWFSFLEEKECSRISRLSHYFWAFANDKDKKVISPPIVRWREQNSFEKIPHISTHFEVTSDLISMQTHRKMDSIEVKFHNDPYENKQSVDWWPVSILDFHLMVHILRRDKKLSAHRSIFQDLFFLPLHDFLKGWDLLRSSSSCVAQADFNVLERHFRFSPESTSDCATVSRRK